MLSVRRVTKRYGDIVALDSATLELERGEVLVTVGPNGAGKSTLLKAIVGLIRADGDVLVDGISVRRDGRGARRRIGYMPQHPAFHPDLNVRETALFYAQLRGPPPGPHARPWRPWDWRSMPRSAWAHSPGGCGNAWRWPSPSSGARPC